LGDWHDVGPRFYWKSLRILNYLAMNGPSHKGKIVRLIRPRIDKPTVYDAITFLQKNRCIELVEKDRSKPVKWNGLAKHYQLTPSGLGELLGRYYDVNKYQVTEKMILRILANNPHLGYGAEWIQVFHALRPLLSSRTEHPEPFSPSPSVLERIGGVRCLVRTGGIYEPRFILSQLISQITFSGRDGEEVSARIRALLELLIPYPTYAKIVRELLVEHLKQATADLQRAKIEMTKIKMAVRALANSSRLMRS
jgi:hypothetical protein